MGSATSIYYNNNKIINKSIKMNDNVIDNQNISILQENLSVKRVSMALSAKTLSNVTDDVEKEKLLDSFNLKINKSNHKFFISPKNSDDDRENEDTFDIIQSQSDISCSLPSSRQSSAQSSPAHGLKLQKALSFRLPKSDTLIHKLKRKLSLNEKRKTIVCEVINENDDKINTFIIETHDYKNDSSKQNYTKFHSFSISPMKSNSDSDIDSIKIKKHTCELCSLTFDDKDKFLDHTKYSKIHEIALLSLQSRLRKLNSIPQ